MKRIELAHTEDEDGEQKATEWIDVNENARKAIVELAMSENLRFGDAALQYLEDRLSDDDDADDDE